MQQQENIASYVIVYTVGFLPSLWLTMCDVCVYLYYCRLLENTHVDSMSGIKENAFLSPLPQCCVFGYLWLYVCICYSCVVVYQCMVYVHPIYFVLNNQCDMKSK